MATTHTSVEITEEVTQVYINNLALPAQDNDALGVSIAPSGSITATNVQDAILQLADHTFRQATAPSGTNVEQGDFWYETDTETLHVYREVSSGSFEWVPILLSTSIVDGGAY